MTKAILALENGSWFEGVSVGAKGDTGGEVVFNTSMTGYQEVLTDPSYAGQLVMMTCPEIGNYGVSEEDIESRGPQVSGFIVRQASSIASNWRASGTLSDYLSSHDIVAIADIDTRALTRMLRSSGVMRGVISTDDVAPEEAIDRARRVLPMEGADLVTRVTCQAPFDWSPDSPGPGSSFPEEFTLPPERRADRPLRIAAYDFGIKWNILRRLGAYGCDIRVFPASAPASELLAIDPDGVFLSNGPGDPAPLDYAVKNVQALVAAEVPTFGICLGHQLLGLALGGKTYKLKFGHRGTNHPVKHLATDKIEITSQNHGFAVDPGSLPSDVMVTHLNLYDGTVEGLRHKSRPAFAVQYHPEASPGPHDADYLFGLFLDVIDERR
ncbi:MAG TPA: glutamine-hydrolyzing carbamoyl-phosphate synthase small subunit [Acidobacteria bacterium]|jgi:carbamoyl-phosphate synthase small subunit|nr:glutamine-hydrolyzing carbamoyl-phosphate synthase small subunit [Acidobacteriota bacterium]HIN69705.1 carbamoyl-phosphate synthase small subunit [Acidobacteriota bacterium]